MLFTGLFKEVTSENELTFVLAHEMVHVVLKHPVKRILSNFSLKIVENIVRTRGAAGQIAKREHK